MPQRNQANRLRSRILARFSLAETTVELPRTRIRVRITLPALFDPLLDASADDPEGNLPYWAMIWPSGVALADVIMAEREHFFGHRVLELGCGLGITATAAVMAGAQLTITDYAGDALLLCRLNALENAGPDPYALQVNWRQPRAALRALAVKPFSHVLAADVLYEQRDVEPLIGLLEHLVAPNGTLWLAEPGRPVARRFLEYAAAQGWQDQIIEHCGPWPGKQDVAVGIHRLSRRT